jgi:hypothetical protein
MSWEATARTWHDTDVDYCDVCGNLLIQRYWSFQGEDGTPLRACREDDVRLYHRLRAAAPRVAEARATWQRTFGIQEPAAGSQS